MKTSSVVNQLEDIIDYSRDCIGDNTVWNDDIEALNEAINIIEEKKERKYKYFLIGYCVGSVITLIFHFLWIVKGGC